MPKGDGTGPAGFGPMTGRKEGICAGFSTPGFIKLKGMRLSRRGFRGRGQRHCFHETGLPYWARKNYYLGNVDYSLNEEEFLTQEADYLKIQLDKVKERLSKIKKSKKEGLDN